MQLPPNSINSYTQVFRLYRYTRLQSQANNTAIKVLHNKLIELIKGILDNSPKTSQTAGQLKGQLNVHVKILKQQLVVAENDSTDFDIPALKKALTKFYSDKQGEEAPTSADFIKFLNDECEEAGNGTDFAIQTLTPEEILAQRLGARIPTALERATGDYAYNRGQFGSTSMLLRNILEGTPIDQINETRGYEGPDDGDDLSRCVFYVEGYLRDKNRASLTEEEKTKISNCSRNWAGVMEHWDTLSAAINNRMPFAQVKALLHECMNGAKLVYGDNEAKQITPAENAEIIEFIRVVAFSGFNQYNLKGRTRVFANQLVKALHLNGYYIEYTFENKGMVNGTIPLSRGRAISYLNKTDFNSYTEKSLLFRPRTPADDVDNAVTKVSNKSIQISF